MILSPNQREQVLPLPVALVSTVDAAGVRNVAPWSNVTPILRPLDELLLASWLKRDTLANIRSTGEFAVSIPPVELAEEVMVCARNYPPEVDEFDVSGLQPRPCERIAPPGVEGCLAWMECTLVEEICRERFSLVVGRVLRLEADDRFFNERGEMDYERARPLMIMAGKKGMRFTRPVTAGRWAEYREMSLSGEDPAVAVAAGPGGRTSAEATEATTDEGDT